MNAPRTSRSPLRLALALALSAMLAACSRPAPAPEPVRAVRTMLVTPGAASLSAEFAAEIKARSEARLGFRVGGKMTERLAELGRPVRAGQVLARLDPQDLRLAEQAAMAALQAAEASAQQADADLKRFRGLFAEGFISEAELARRETTATAARAQWQQAQAQSSMQRNQAAYSTLTAPADGVVTALLAEPGAVLAAGAPVVQLAQDGPRDAVFSVPEDAAATLRALRGRAGALEVRLWGRETSLPATVREVAASADAATRTFLVKADLGAAAVELGQTASVTLSLPPRTGALRLPLSALKQHEGGSVVWLLDGQTMTVRAQAVQVTGADGNEALIAGGLPAAAEVVTAGVHLLSEGQKVTRYRPAALPAGASAAAR